ncbi:hypothetical protein PAPYR_8893 [Paratrimastix pyriformis]|uniref:Sphingomyelin synthase-like domain-containing protein n=1 Tax=Paratrimastix pyriformis TaxID=342808 RepID=A0ABQ8UEE8_9EUKA|nr:hypothetical protein PAPYR_8893 [Paratrimastix pyriformis]
MRNCSSIRSELGRVSGTFIVAFMAFYLMSAVQILIEDAPNTDRYIFDAGHYFLPSLERWPWIPNLAVTIWSCGFLVYLILLGDGISGRLCLFRRFLILQTMIFLLRSITISVTILPDPMIVPRTNPLDKYPWPLRPLLVMVGILPTTRDYIFSGHTATAVLVARLIFNHTKWKKLWFPILLVGLLGTLAVFTMVGCFFTLSIDDPQKARFHYTVDIFLGLVLAWLLFDWYITRVQSPPTTSLKLLWWLDRPLPLWTDTPRPVMAPLPPQADLEALPAPPDPALSLEGTTDIMKKASGGASCEKWSDI